MGQTSRVVALVAAVLTLLASACSDDSDGDPRAGDGGPTRVDLACAWPMWGQNVERTFSYPDECETSIAPDTAATLERRWFTATDDVVTATPAIVGNTAYVGDWSGNVYALSVEDGSERWRFRAPEHPNVYSGQIVSSAAVGEVDGELLVFVASGKTLYALRASDGEPRWDHELNPGGGDDDPTEIQSSPVLVGDMVLFGFDGHNEPGVRAGVRALDARSGAVRWTFDPDAGGEPTGCAGVWSSPSVDTERGLVFFGTANCPTSPEGWTEYSEAIVAIDLETGEPAWSFQPRGPSNNDFDFAGAPNLFEMDGRALVGLGGKDGVYYALDRERGELVWKVEASIPRVQSPNFSTGGFIGATAVDDGIVVGGTAVDGPCPCLHGIDANTGTMKWQQPAAAPTFAPSAIVNGVAFVGSTTDFTLRALDLATGEVLWSHVMGGGVAGGVAISGDWVIGVSGIREPGIDPAGSGFGVSGFTLGEGEQGPTTTTGDGEKLPPTTAAPPADPSFVAGDARPRCIAGPCALDFTLTAPPPGTNPAVTLHLTPSPFRLEVRADGLGDPAAWVKPGTPAAERGAVAYGVFANDDALRGTLLCVLDASYDCVTEEVPPDATSEYNRISVLAIEDSPELPEPSDGFNRLVTTVSLEEAVRLR